MPTTTYYTCSRCLHDFAGYDKFIDHFATDAGRVNFNECREDGR